MSNVNTAVQDGAGPFPWLDRDKITSKYGDSVMHEINEILSYMWNIVIKYGMNQSVSDFGGKCRIAAKEQYPLLEDKTIDILAHSLEYSYWK